MDIKTKKPGTSCPGLRSFASCEWWCLPFYPHGWTEWRGDLDGPGTTTRAGAAIRVKHDPGIVTEVPLDNLPYRLSRLMARAVEEVEIRAQGAPDARARTRPGPGTDCRSGRTGRDSEEVSRSDPPGAQAPWVRGEPQGQGRRLFSEARAERHY